MDRKEMVQTLDKEISQLTTARNMLAGESATGTGRGRAATGETGKRGPGRPKGSTNAGSAPRGGARAGAGRPRGSGRDSNESSATVATAATAE